ncbi:thermonuclease family protein [Skermanella mucosa]|uniref:thermonuclease family protein n=1 Tax=Skermanella mucosa TaxID=1789672 RepID=UPI00192CBFB0|nr:thermonuclease family protein [Skermanella mucosa]UEM23769.1 thermonuclease family protein [Skermanella mucosa]
MLTALSVGAAARHSPALDRQASEGTVPTEVIDGDTVQAGSEVYELAGIDAPELGQRCLNSASLYACGQEASFALRKMIGITAVSCTRQPDGDGVECAGSAGNLGLLLVKQGFAVARPGAAPAYLEAQRVAKDSKLGIWRGDFVPSVRWRQGDRLEAERQSPAPCPVKAAVEQSGRKVYLVPTDSVYDKVTPDQEAGGRLFCSDEEARAAGFERPAS